jgi:hypothetical protein
MQKSCRNCSLAIFLVEVEHLSIIPVFGPHDLPHRRVSLLHLSGVPWARIREAVGHDLVTAARSYSHVMADETELNYRALLDRT